MSLPWPKPFNIMWPLKLFSFTQGSVRFIHDDLYCPKVKIMQNYAWLWSTYICKQRKCKQKTEESAVSGEKERQKGECKIDYTEESGTPEHK